MSLTKYRQKRDFRKTAEPRGQAPRRRERGALRFVIQKHDASHLHYDFRLELDGVLKSWAIPKGPSLDPSQKRLAIEVEDHPLEYGSFEGIIPPGEYGGGTVLLWDQGVWIPRDDPRQAYRAGKLKFELRGEKLRGAWMLVRRGVERGGKPQWLLFKERDDEARATGDAEITALAPESVATGRDLPAIAAASDRVWARGGETDSTAAGSKRPASRRSIARTAGHTAKPAASAKRPAASKPAASKPAASVAANNGRAAHRAAKQGRAKTARVRGSQPAKGVLPGIDAQLATLVDKPPSGEPWFHEIKFDGYRMLCEVSGGQARMETRNHQDWTGKLPALSEALEKLAVRQAVFDGEIVALDERGRSNFERLQAALQGQERASVVYEVFDLLFLDGEDLRPRPLAERKAALAALQLPVDRGLVRYSEHLEGDGAEAFAAAAQEGLEGIISKRRDRPYRAGRGADWLKIKCHQHAEFVIGGFTGPQGQRLHFGALLLGYHDSEGKLRYAGKVGAGFTDRTLRDLHKRLRPLEQDDSPFSDPLPRGAAGKSGAWVRPRLVAQVAFSNWTRDGMLRHPSFEGLREDKPASDVTRERARPLRAATRGAKRRAAAGEVMIAGVRVTHPDKLLYPEAGITKAMLAEYYLRHAERILPQLVNRPLAIVRCPEGVDGERFFQKHPGAGTPDALRRVKVREKTKTEEMLCVVDAAGLVALAQISALEIHVWGSRVDQLERPDRLVFDLDPAPDVPWRRVVQGAEEIRQFLAALDLRSFLKTSGGKGLHIVAPIERRNDWSEVADFCHRVALAIERAAPDRYVANMSKQKRTGKIFVDYLRNQRGATSVAAYSTRARSLAPLSVPIDWSETPKLKSPDGVHLKDADRAFSGQRGAPDPWAEIDSTRQALKKSLWTKLRLV